MDNDFDATEYWNTPLDPDHEAEFQAWAKRGNYLKDLYDYDMRGAYMSGIRPDAQSGHWPDTYKKPNHPTFSDESQYHGSEGHMGGYWEPDETGTETWHPYDPKRDPQALEHAVGNATAWTGIQRAGAGITGESNNNDVVDRLQHPSYQQLADDKDLRRGRTRMAPRGEGAEGGFGYAEGGEVQQAAAGDERTIEGLPYRSYGTLGTRQGGDRFNPADREGDLDKERWERDRSEPSNDYRDFRGEDAPDPNDAKGWRREYWRRVRPPTEVPTMQQGGAVEKNPYHTEMTDELYPGAGQGEGDEEMSDEDIERLEAGKGKGGRLWVEDPPEDPEGRPPTNLPDKPRIIRKQLSDPEHGTWHDDGRHQIFTPHPSFFARVKPMELADHFERYAPDDHHLNLP